MGAAKEARSVDTWLAAYLLTKDPRLPVVPYSCYVVCRFIPYVDDVLDSGQLLTPTRTLT